MQDTAEKLVEVIESTSDCSARIWTGTDRVRVYVTRQLSRRQQTMGYIEIQDDESIKVYAERQASWFNEWVQAIR
jgi:hypothetical protein